MWGRIYAHISKIQTDKPRVIGTAKVVEVVASITGVSVANITGNVRKPNYVMARTLLCKVLTERFGLTDREAAEIIKKERSAMTHYRARFDSYKTNSMEIYTYESILTRLNNTVLTK